MGLTLDRHPRLEVAAIGALILRGDPGGDRLQTLETGTRVERGAQGARVEGGPTTRAGGIELDGPSQCLPTTRAADNVVKTRHVRCPVLTVDDGARCTLAPGLVRRLLWHALAGIILIAALPILSVTHRRVASDCAI